MEIHKQNLVSFSLQEDRLQCNFIVIQTTLKALQQQIELMKKQQQSISTNITQSQHKIENLFGVTTNHTSQIHAQKVFIDQLNSQLNSFDSTGVQQQRSRTPIEKQDLIQNNQEKAEKESKGVMLQKSEKRQSNSLKPVEKDGKKVNEGRNLFQKALSNIKERLIVLQKDSQQKDQTISEINRYIRQKKNKQNDFFQRRISKDLASKQAYNQKNDIRLLAQLQQSKEKDQFKIDSSRTLNKIDVCEDIDSENVLSGAQSFTPQLQDILLKQIQKIKNLFQQKTRILDLHLKQNQAKIQNIEKNIDILERSHDLLKYDFERSSTSWSKNRPNNQTQDTKHRPGDQRLNDTRITQKEYYQQKLVQLFNQMDVLKGQYLQIHNKIEKEDSEIPILGNDGRQNFKNRMAQKLAHNKDESDEISKRQLLNCRRDLKKLRQQFQEFANGVNTGSNETKTYIIKPNQNKQDWKSLSTKIYKLKMELQAGVRELEGKIVTNNDMVVVLNQLQVGIEECRLLMKKKVETSDFQKAIKRVEGRLNNFILQVFEKQNKNNEADATITKKPWFCLSCDSEFTNYTGKLQKSSSPAQKLMGRKVNPELHMVRRNQNSRLPSVLK